MILQSFLHGRMSARRSQHPEIRTVFQRNRFCDDILDPDKRALSDLKQELPESPPFSFELHFDIPVRKVPDIPGDPESSCIPYRAEAEPDSLNGSFDQIMLPYDQTGYLPSQSFRKLFS